MRKKKSLNRMFDEINIDEINEDIQNEEQVINNNSEESIKRQKGDKIKEVNANTQKISLENNVVIKKQNYETRKRH